jgi:hypothetical protein
LKEEKSMPDKKLIELADILALDREADDELIKTDLNKAYRHIVKPFFNKLYDKINREDRSWTKVWSHRDGKKDKPYEKLAFYKVELKHGDKPDFGWYWGWLNNLPIAICINPTNDLEIREIETNNLSNNLLWGLWARFDLDDDASDQLRAKCTEFSSSTSVRFALKDVFDSNVIVDNNGLEAWRHKSADEIRGVTADQLVDEISADILVWLKKFENIREMDVLKSAYMEYMEEDENEDKNEDISTMNSKMLHSDDFWSLDTDLRTHLEEAGCVVLQGPPGSGKTYCAETFIRTLATNSDSAGNASNAQMDECQWSSLRARYNNSLKECVHASRTNNLKVIWDIVQLHPGYAYEDLVRGLVTANSDSGGIQFKAQDRVLVELAHVAQQVEFPVVLVLDEINRCNLSAVLGEAILLLEKSKRGSSRVRLQYPNADGVNDTLMLPDNLWIIGTMNTADRSIALIDYAIRRRFRFLDVLPNTNAIAQYYTNRQFPHLVPRVINLFNTLNDVVKEERLRIGHSYFMVDPGKTGDDRWSRRIARRIVFEVLPLLREYKEEGLLKPTFTIVTLAGKPFNLGAAPTSAEAKEHVETLSGILSEGVE